MTASFSIHAQPALASSFVPLGAQPLYAVARTSSTNSASAPAPLAFLPGSSIWAGTTSATAGCTSCIPEDAQMRVNELSKFTSADLIQPSTEVPVRAMKSGSTEILQHLSDKRGRPKYQCAVTNPLWGGRQSSIGLVCSILVLCLISVGRWLAPV